MMSGPAPTFAAIPPSASDPDDDCPAFRSDEERDLFASSIAPRRELVCPITQECFIDGVVAEGEHYVSLCVHVQKYLCSALGDLRLSSTAFGYVYLCISALQY